MQVAKKQLSLLVDLARIDGVIAEEESEWIHSVGKAHGLSREEVDEIFQSPKTEILTEHLSEDERFDYLYSVVQLMKIDGKLFRSEIKYCNEMAVKLGYDPGVMFELMTKVYSDPSITTDRAKLKKKVQKYLRH